MAPQIQTPSDIDIEGSFAGWLKQVEVQDQACIEQSLQDHVTKLNRAKAIRKATEEDCYYEGYADAHELQSGLRQEAKEYTASSQDTLQLADPRPSSPLSVIPNSSSPIRALKVIKPLPKVERLERAVAAVKEGASARQSAHVYGVNRNTIHQRTEGSQSQSEFAVS